ncbi:hypothetical protein K6119_12610 [Paracrocinitomix mangrovi]|uniref:hypothetical protein n=1 Tax=Paracrocinitomix mangrovi TaxID=2862509 RepID=UPI001C8EE1CC|nr:hypothetical protein [Paracrocinitomix mangrovi]UKN00572.1 hypothetical protein K6119_12610 [Paracrocinitomix mangrovi]
MSLFIHSCDSGIDKTPSVIEFPEDTTTETQIVCERTQLSNSIYKGERIKKNTIVRDAINGDRIYKIHKDSLAVELSSEDFGSWEYLAFDVRPEYEIKEIDKGYIYQEIWHEDEKLVTIYYYDPIKKITPSWYDNDYIAGFIRKSAVYSGTSPFKQYNDLKNEGKFLIEDYLSFLNAHQFSSHLSVTEKGNCREEFILFNSHVDGPRSFSRMSITFINDTLLQYSSEKKDVK